MRSRPVFALHIVVVVVVFKEVDLVKRQFLCVVHSLLSAGFLMYLFMNDFLPGCLFAVVI